MKCLILFSLFGLAGLPHNEFRTTENKVNYAYKQTFSQPEPCYTRISATIFKNQEYCRAEVPDFDFDTHFTILSPTLYFSGANFNGVENGSITSPSLKPVASLMKRCIPGSIVIFDDVKVKGPDNEIRTITGPAYKLF